jgi:hypothetical protein
MVKTRGANKNIPAQLNPCRPLSAAFEESFLFFYAVAAPPALRGALCAPAPALASSPGSPASPSSASSSFSSASSSAPSAPPAPSAAPPHLHSPLQPQGAAAAAFLHLHSPSLHPQGKVAAVAASSTPSLAAAPSAAPPHLHSPLHPQGAGASAVASAAAFLHLHSPSLHPQGKGASALRGNSSSFAAAASASC